MRLKRCCRCIVTSLADVNTLLFDHLLSLKPVKFLEGELIHEVTTACRQYSVSSDCVTAAWLLLLLLFYITVIRCMHKLSDYCSKTSAKQTEIVIFVLFSASDNICDGQN